MNLFHSAKVAFFLSLTTLFTLPTSAVAATPLSDNWFQVEMMLVAYRNNSDIDQEYWPKVILDSQSLFATMTPKSRRLDPVAKHYRYRRLQTQFLNAIKLPVRLPDSLWQPLAPLSSLKLKREANRINPQADMDVVWHQSWLEPVQSQEGTIVHKVNLTVGGEPEIQITGGFSLYLSRYLHISTDFHVQHLSSQMPAEPQLQAFSTAINTDGTSTPAILASQQPLTIHGLYPIRATEVRQKRRMRSKELHYIDHPMLGVVLIITPVEFPDLTAGE
ncbi:MULTISPECIES: CsiV family protein [unclassified Oceanobacter]|uniref:CsiV family protein n=1 Tax=unclassified Oceanobacter TaxID=2620260 RepID=UPI002734A33C|nr:MULTISPECIES: CsiV family protein [unclassified Oceanobacter]MDP2506669.1 CsiV family protein [Oceanobacter sp. 3_MG-2023]MDP2548664.1 CsiV family protein [Oceanobacter sp. 4_MG-2023]